MLECERCHVAIAAGMFRLHMTPLWRRGRLVRPQPQHKLLCGDCGLGGGALTDKRIYDRKGPQLGSFQEDMVSAVPKVERVELLRSVNL